MLWAYCKTIYFIQFYRLNDLVNLERVSVALKYWFIGLFFHLCALIWLDRGCYMIFQLNQNA